MSGLIVAMWFRLLIAATSLAAYAQEFPRGQIIDDVKCKSNVSQSYSLYLPSNYSPARTWSVIFAFDPGGRGRRGVERYQAAAEKYGYIVAGSNNSRNGPWNVSLAAAEAMSNDVTERFSVDKKRVYTAGHSGGARVAMKVALDSGRIAGVFASSAGFPGGEQRKSLPFPVFGTAGTEDFNYLEMRQLDRELTSAHRVVIFEGGHTWLPSDLAVEAVEWMEVQAMKSGLRPRDEKLFHKSFPAAKVPEDRAAEQHEAKVLSRLYELEGSLDEGGSVRQGSLASLKNLFGDLSRQAKAPADTAERREARRIIGGILVGSRSIDDPQYQELLGIIRPPEAGVR